MSDHPAPTPFERIIEPLGRERFLRDHWGKSFVRIPGQPGRFANDFSWAELNEILGTHDFVLSRAKLVRGGKTVDPAQYTTQGRGLRSLKAGSMVNHLSAGATLIVDEIDEFSPGVRKITESCQREFRTWTCVNLYASWRKQNGFDLHWDTQETFMVQVSGRKHWKVYAPTKAFPLPADQDKLPKPSEPPVWEGILEDGDVLYVPRGWWHIAASVDEPSLHLTVTIMPPEGTDLLESLVAELRDFAHVRRNLPLPGDAKDKEEYVRALRELILSRCDDRMLDRFLAEWESNLPARPKIDLPRAPVDAAAPMTPETRVRLAANLQLRFIEAAASEAVFFANGVRWNCPAALVPALECLRSTDSVPVRDLCARLDDAALSKKLVTFLSVLAMGGVVWGESPH